MKRNTLKGIISQFLDGVFGSLLLFVFLIAFAAPAGAVNKVPLKPDGTLTAPCTVWGTPSLGLACGKATANTEVIDVVGNVKATGYFVGSISSGSLASGSIDTTKLASDAVTTVKILNLNVTTAKIAASAVDTTKLATDAVTSASILNGTIIAADIASGAIDTSKISKVSAGSGALCEMNDGTGKFGHCTAASAVTCTCQ